MDMLDFIISLEILSFPGTLPVFSSIGALRISSRNCIIKNRVIYFREISILDTLKLTNFSNSLFEVSVIEHSFFLNNETIHLRLLHLLFY